MKHSNLVRQMKLQQRRSVQQRADNVPCRPVCGGLQVLLDASKAFDMVPRQPLFAFLQGLQVDQALVHLLACWHSNTTYVVKHGSTHHAVGSGRGLRQGCPSAPVLWSCYTLDMFHQLTAAIDENWVKQCLTTLLMTFIAVRHFRMNMNYMLRFSAFGCYSTSWNC